LLDQYSDSTKPKRYHYHHRFEPILRDWLPDAAHYFVDDRSQTDVFEGRQNPTSANFIRPTKPVELIVRLVRITYRWIP